MPKDGNRRKWSRFGLGSVIVWAILVAANTVRLGVVDHLWPLAIGLDVALVLAIPIVTIWLRRHDSSRLAISPAGTIYVGGVSFRGSQFADQPPLSRFLSGAKFRSVGGGWLSGTLMISDTGLHIEPGRFFGRGLLPVAIDWNEVRSTELTKVPGKVNVGGLDLTLSDGSTLALEARGYDRLRPTLAEIDRRT